MLRASGWLRFRLTVESAPYWCRASGRSSSIASFVCSKRKGTVLRSCISEGCCPLHLQTSSRLSSGFALISVEDELVKADCRVKSRSSQLPGKASQPAMSLVAQPPRHPQRLDRHQEDRPQGRLPLQGVDKRPTDQWLRRPHRPAERERRLLDGYVDQPLPHPEQPLLL